MIDHVAIREEFAREMQALVGLALWASGRAGNMQWFQFGGRIPRTNRHGEAREVGTYAVHVQCPWRVLDGDVVVVGSGDLDFDPSGQLPTAGDATKHPTLLDVRMKQLLSKDLRLASVDVSRLAAVRLFFSSTQVLELVPIESVPLEQWRLLRNVEPTNHWIVSSTGVEKA